MHQGFKSSLYVYDRKKESQIYAADALKRQNP